MRRPPRIWRGSAPALGAVAAHGVDQRDVDRDDDDRRGDEADPKQGVDLVGARRVGRQSAAILITPERRAAVPVLARRPILAEPDAEALRPSPALRLAVRAGAAGAVAAAVAVPLLRRRLRIPAPVTVAACAGGPLALAVLCPALEASATSRCSRCRCGPSRWSTSFPTTIRERLRAPPAHPLPDRRSTARSALGRLPNARLQRALARAAAGSATIDRFLTWVHWLWFFEPYLRPGLDPRPPQRALPARRAPARRRLRHRLRRLLRRADRAALVGLRAGADRGGGAADHGRGRRGDLGLGLAGDVRGARRQPLGGDALAALRDLADGGARALRGRAGRGRRSAGATRSPSASPSSTSASTTSPTCSPGRRLVAAVRRGEPLAEPLVLRRQRRSAALGAPRQRVASLGCLRRTPANGDDDRSSCRCSRRGGWSRRPSSSSRCWSGSTSSSRSWSGWATRWASSTKPSRSGSRSRSASTSSPSPPTSRSSRRSSAAERCASPGARPTRSTWPGLAATLLFSAGGAGGIVLTYWALRKAGMRRRDVGAADGRLPHPPLRLLPAGADRLRGAAADRRAAWRGLGRADDRAGRRSPGCCSSLGRADRADPAGPGAPRVARFVHGERGRGDRRRHDRQSAGDPRRGVPVRASASSPTPRAVGSR